MRWAIRALIAGILATVLAVLHRYSPLRLSSVVPYAGLILVVTGLACLVHPVRTLFVRTRKAALGLIAAGLVGAALALFWPTSTTTVLERKSLLDQAMPQFEFAEHHGIRVHASPQETYSALLAVTVDDLAAYPVLMKIRSGAMGRRWRKPQGPSPAIIAVFSNPTSGYSLIERTGREMVFGGLGRVSSADRPVLSSPTAFASFDQGGVVKVAFNLTVDDSGDGWSTLSTETRLRGLDPASRRGMAVYWRLIYPGSGMLRTMWLEAARARAEKAR